MNDFDKEIKKLWLWHLARDVLSFLFVCAVFGFVMSEWVLL
jgi:hypothetical protein